MQEDKRTDGQQQADDLESARKSLLRYYRRKNRKLPNCADLSEEMAQEAICFLWREVERTGKRVEECIYSARLRVNGNRSFAPRSEKGRGKGGKGSCVLRGDQPAPRVVRLDGREWVDHNGNGGPFLTKSEPDDSFCTRDPAPEVGHRIDRENWQATLPRFARTVLGLLRQGYDYWETAVVLGKPIEKVLAARDLLRATVSNLLLPEGAQV